MTFPDFLATLGIISPAIFQPGQWIRCPTQDHPKSRNGAFKLFPDGLAGVAQNHGTMSDVAIWHRGGDRRPAITPEKLREQMSLARAERESSERASTHKAWIYWNLAKPVRASHPYLDKKRLDLTGARELRVDLDGKLLVPMFDERRAFKSLQYIDAEGGKKFWFGAPASGVRYMFCRGGTTVWILCEGVSTGLTLFAACPNASVVVAFSAHNMAAVARSRTWKGMCVVAGDNDADTQERTGTNPGAKMAQEAAEAIGCGVAMPASGGDWNDVYCAGLAKLEEQAKSMAFVPSIHRLRSQAMIPVRNAVMRFAKYVAPK